jgi:hypothetical protein
MRHPLPKLLAIGDRGVILGQPCCIAILRPSDGPEGFHSLKSLLHNCDGLLQFVQWFRRCFGYEHQNFGYPKTAAGSSR